MRYSTMDTPILFLLAAGAMLMWHIGMIIRNEKAIEKLLKRFGWPGWDGQI
jgi:hypothetical protein